MTCPGAAPPCTCAAVPEPTGTCWVVGVAAPAAGSLLALPASTGSTATGLLLLLLPAATGSELVLLVLVPLPLLLVEVVVVPSPFVVLTKVDPLPPPTLLLLLAVPPLPAFQVLTL